MSYGTFKTGGSRSKSARRAGLVLLVFGLNLQCMYYQAAETDFTSPDSVAFWLMNLLLGDSLKFQISSVTPADGASNVATNTQIALDFNRQVDAATVSVQSADGTCVSAPIQLSVDGFTSCLGLSIDLSSNPRLILTPVTILAANTTHTLRISTDLLSTSAESLSAARIISFTTGAALDLTPPADASAPVATPQASGAINLAWSNPGDVDFSGVKILRVPGATCTTDPNDGAATVVYNSNGTAYSDTATTHTQQYCYTIFAYDTSGNFAPGAAGAQATATANDSTAPTVTGATPTSGATGQAVNQTVSITFSEVMNAATITTAGADGACSGTIEVRVGPGFTTCKGFTITTGDNTTFSLTPAGNHLEATEYRINVLVGAQDVAGNGATVFNQSPGYTTGDFTAPTVSNVTSTTADGTYGGGQVINVQVVFNENITVNTGGGTPSLTLETGGTDAPATFGSVTGGNTMNFSFTVANPYLATDLDYLNTTTLVTNGGTIQDGAGNNAVLTLPAPGAAGSLGNNKALVIDGVPPSVSGVSSSTADGTYGVGQTVVIQITWSENVSVTGTPTLTLETGATDAVVNYTSTTANVSDFNYLIAAGHTSADLDYQATNSLTAGTSITDAAGNNATLTLPTPGAAGSLGNNKAIVVNTAVSSVLPDTGQTTCYWDNAGTWTADPTCTAGTYAAGDATYPLGQDAHYANTPAAFALTASNGNTTVTETTSGLTFENGTGASGIVIQSAAVTYCTGLGTAGLTWRVPSVRELFMHYHFGFASPATDTAANLFSGTGASIFYWTSQGSAIAPGEFWNIGYNYPTVQDDLPTSGSRQVRCVAGTAFPPPAFSGGNVGADYYTSDATTGLMWTKCSLATGGTPLDAGGGACTLPGGPDIFDWKGALTACENLNYAGFTDWRLPNIRELFSLANHGAATAPMISALDFPQTASGIYFSSTTMNSLPARAHTVDFSDGSLNPLGDGAKTTARYVRCVR